MINFLLFTFIVVLTDSVLAQRSSELSKGVSGRVVGKIGGCVGSGCKGSFEAYPLRNSYFKSNKRTANCNEYIHNTSGQFGVKGRKLEALMSKYPQFYQAQPSQDMATVCPRFSSFSKDQKTHFWVWFWAALALDEATCGKDNRAQGVNGVAVGDFQMEDQQSLRSYRPVPCPGKKNMSTFDNNAGCAVAIMNQQLNSRKKIFNTRSYWQKLNRGTDVKTLLQKYPACR